MENKNNYTFYCFAGHHNNDSGAVGVGGIKEANKTKQWRDLTAKRFKQIRPSANVVTDNDNMILRDLIAQTKKTIKSNDSLIEFHYNSASKIANGIEVFVDDNASSRSKEIAKKIVDVMSKITDLPNRGVKTESQSNRGQLGILGMKGAAILIEVGFINNPKDVDQTDKWMHWICEEIAEIIAADYDSQNK